MSIESYPSPNGVLTSLIWRKTMSGGETSLSGYDNASQALSYTPGQEQVYLNGILLVRGDDYTATNGTSITGLSALAASDFVQVNCYNNFSVASVPAQNITGTVTNAQLANSAITINGSAISLGGSVTLAGDIESVTAGTGLTGGGNSGPVTLAIDTSVVVDKTTVQTLTNKTFTAPIISTISNTGTVTLPTSTDTLIGRATTDTLTNKTLTAPLINLAITTNSGAYTLQASDSGKLIEMSSATAVALTVPPSVFAAGEQVNVIATGSVAAMITFTAGSGVTILSTGATSAAPKLRAQYSSATLICKIGGATPTFYVVGDIF